MWEAGQESGGGGAGFVRLGKAREKLRSLFREREASREVLFFVEREHTF